MDDLGQVLRDLNHLALTHSVTYFHGDDGRAAEAHVHCPTVPFGAVFTYLGTHWDLTAAEVDGGTETITGLLASIREIR